MTKLTLGQAAAWCGGRVDPKYADIAFFGANNDSRKMKCGELFVVLSGARDGHDFIPMAMEKGAAASLCIRQVGDYPCILVNDPRIALGRIAAEYRRSLSMQVVAVTGSVGKSTTKEMIAAVLKRKYKVAKTPENHNNDIGMPMAILAIPEDTQVAVLEMGMNHFGEISYLTGIGRPDLAVITNIGTMHIENLGSKEGIRQAKFEIQEGMPQNGRLILNGDDPMLLRAPNITRSAVYVGSCNPQCDVFAENVHTAADGIYFTARYSEGEIPVFLPVEGRHYVADALSAIGVGLAMGVEPGQIAAALAEFRNMAGRQEIFDFQGITVIRDCYNAGPESMAAALEVLSGRPGRHVALLGDMLELGDVAPKAHETVGTQAAHAAQVLLAYGPNSKYMVRGARAEGMADARDFTDRNEIARALAETLHAGDVLLVKGSHGMHMELILDKFMQDTKN